MKWRKKKQDMDRLSDAEIMSLASDDNPEAFRVLVEKHQTPLLNFFRKLGVYTDAEDLVQQSFIRIYRNRKTYHADAKFSTYLYTVARSVWVDWVRKQARREDKLSAYQEHLITHEDPGETLTSQQLDLREAVERLPEKLRLVVVMSVYQGMKYREISEVLNIPEGTVKSRMSLAMDHLKEGIYGRCR